MLSSAISSNRRSILYKFRSTYYSGISRSSASKSSPVSPSSDLSDQQYARLSQIEHVLARPGMYVGQMQPSISETWLVNKELNIMQKESVVFSPALVKIFDEILVNAADNKQNDPKMSKIEIQVTDNNKGGLRITVRNNGKGIPTGMHEKEKIHIPELIFGNLLTGSNFDDEKSRVVGGRHGYGAKLTNIFSDVFEIETQDSKKQLLYQQRWQDNMSFLTPPKIKKSAKTVTDYTQVTFEPDLSRFYATDIAAETSAAMKNNLVESSIRLFERRAYDVAATLPGVQVSFNDAVIPIQNFSDYVRMFSPISMQSSNVDQSEISVSAVTAEHSDDPDVLMDEHPMVYAKINNRWEVAVIRSTGSFDCVSFVNNVWTSKGGTHVNLVTDQIVKAVESALGSKKRSSNPSFIRNRLLVFVNCLVDNPDFDSQSKDNLTSVNTVTIKDCKLSKSFLKSVVDDLGLVEDVLHDISLRDRRKLKSAATTKTSRNHFVDVPKLQDAHFAGGSKSTDCTLVLTEGDSAMALAVAGLEVVGREKFGVLPLKGKILNVRVASLKGMRDNAELVNLCKALGLDFDNEYANGIEKQGLRYGKVMIMCDQDNDGSHIKGLVINFFQHFWPNLLKIEGFLQQFVTPLVKVREKSTLASDKNGKKSKKADEQVLAFYSMPQYEEWRRTMGADSAYMKKQQVKYYKGLGTNTAEEGKSYFRDLKQHKKLFHWGPGDLDALDLAFSGTRAQDRRAWLSQDYDSSVYIDPDKTSISYEEFVRKELIHFSFADNQRSLPSAIDGLKPSQRKVLFGCFKKNLDSEVKVVQLAGYIAEKTCYHHGEQSLYTTIVNMAQDFVGSNNIPLLTAAGQFGTRAQGGKDYASPRYIYTRLTPMARALFPEADDSLLEYLEEDGISVEPRYFLPILPVLLLNGCSGIGTGWSTTIPPYNLTEVADHVAMRVRGQTPTVPLAPWGRGFIGEMRQSGSSFITHGIIKRLSPTTLEISELPYGTWTENYKRHLVKMCLAKQITKYAENHTSGSVLFKIISTKESLDTLEAEGLSEAFKLTANISLLNMHAFDANGAIRKYCSPEEIVEDYFPVRLAAYTTRKENLMMRYAAEEAMSRSKCRFITEILSGDLDVLRRGGGGAVAEGDLIKDLTDRGYPTRIQIKDIEGPSLTLIRGVSSQGIADTEEAFESNGEDTQLLETCTPHSQGPPLDRASYAYLLDLPIRSLTDVRGAALLKEADDTKAKLNTLQGLSVSDMWLADLEVLKETYNRLYS